MKFKRTLRRGMSGNDVLYIKQKLFSAGYYAPRITAIRRTVFGSDTLAAVRSFQRVHEDARGKPLVVDGIIGTKTWHSIQETAAVSRDETIPSHIGPVAAAAIAPALNKAPALRQELTLLALSFAYDPAVPAPYPRSLYIWGGNLYGSDKRLNVISAARIRSGAKAKPSLYSDGRMEMMLSAVADDPTLSGADCSGGIVGLLRYFQLVPPTFDATADALASSRYSRQKGKEALLPGDYVGRSGHIGLYVGGGYVVEWMGGAYGCQLSKLDRRQGWDFVSGKLRTRPSWTRYRAPLVFEQ